MKNMSRSNGRKHRKDRIMFKKRVLSVVMLTVITASMIFTGCGKKEEKPSGTASTVQENGTESATKEETIAYGSDADHPAEEGISPGNAPEEKPVEEDDAASRILKAMYEEESIIGYMKDIKAVERASDGYKMPQHSSVTATITGNEEEMIDVLSGIAQEVDVPKNMDDIWFEDSIVDQLKKERVTHKFMSAHPLPYQGLATADIYITKSGGESHIYFFIY